MEWGHDDHLGDALDNAEGLPIYPGFIDSHAHFYGLGFSNAQVDLKGTKSLEEIVEKVIEFDKLNSLNIVK